MRGVTLTEEVVPPQRRAGLGAAGDRRGRRRAAGADHARRCCRPATRALRIGIDAPYSLQYIAMLIVLKSLASAISIGSGFRGGLFFASLFLGALMGKLFAACLAMVTASTRRARRWCAPSSA